ncbi:MAG: CBS domain-containing protein, partial [Acidimicrobiales bacterium]
LTRMEPDEAVDALRDLDQTDRQDLLDHMTEEQRTTLTDLLDYEEDKAGGFMTTRLVTGTRDETVASVRARLLAETSHAGDIDGVAVIAADGTFQGDVELFSLTVAEPDDTMGSLLGEGDPVSVHVDTAFNQVAERLIDTRHSSVVVVDDSGCPVGRILADDLIDALLPERGRLHFPRLLT